MLLELLVDVEAGDVVRDVLYRVRHEVERERERPVQVDPVEEELFLRQLQRAQHVVVVRRLLVEVLEYRREQLSLCYKVREEDGGVVVDGRVGNHVAERNLFGVGVDLVLGEEADPTRADRERREVRDDRCAGRDDAEEPQLRVERDERLDDDEKEACDDDEQRCRRKLT